MPPLETPDFAAPPFSLPLTSRQTFPPMISYQDGTTQELLVAQQQADGTWMHFSIAGATDPWPGAYGFFASAALRASDVVLSSWVIDQPTDSSWVQVFVKPTLIQ